MTIFGWDASHFDQVPNGARTVAEGIDFTTHKAGGDANDPELHAWWAAMRPYRDQVLLGAYWVLYPGDPVGRADAFLARLDANCSGWRDGPFILQADCEKWNGNPATVPSKAEIRAFCGRLAAKMPKLRPIVYAPKWVYGDALTGLGYPLWASSYVTGSGGFKSLYPGDNSVRWAEYSGQTPEILQYTSAAVIAGQTTCDANAYRGTLEDLTALVAPGWSDTMPTVDDYAAAVVKKIRTTFPVLSDSDRNAIIGPIAAKQDALAKAIAALAGGAVTEADIAALQASIGQVDDEVVARLTGGSDQEVADALKAALGDRAAAIAALLAA